MGARKRILIVAGNLQPGNGGSCVTSWTIEALRADYDVTLLTWHPPRLDALNACFGTHLRSHDVRILHASMQVRTLVWLLKPVHFLRQALLMRWVRRQARRFEITMSCDDEMDFGVRGIQYIHCPWMADACRGRGLRGLFNRAWGRALDISMARLTRNLTLANSRYVEERIRRDYHVEAKIVYPPAPTGCEAGLPWVERPDDFICIGRFSASKEVPRVIEIVARVRDRYPHLALHLVGCRKGYRREFARLQALCRGKEEWVRFHTDVTRETLNALLARSRYGIHGMRGEHYGVCVAEMLQAGCIPFVPDEGGPREIVGGEAVLTYRSVDEAVRKICRVMADTSLQQQLRVRLAERQARHSTEAFVSAVRGVVGSF